MAITLTAKITGFDDGIADLTLFIKNGSATVRSYTRMNESMLKDFLFSKCDNYVWSAKKGKPEWLT